jgi:hypothetical protein
MHLRNLKCWLLLGLIFSLQACIFFGKKTVKGDGIVITQEKNVSSSKKIKVKGNFTVLLQQGANSTVSIQTDKNLMEYIVASVNDDGTLVISTQSGYNLKPSSDIVVIISSSKIDYLSLAGSGNIISKDKFLDSEKVQLSISGNGNINFKTNTPKLTANITGNGNIIVEGETKDVDVAITGSGDFKGEKLLAENGNIKITGSGNAYVFCSITLKANITGSGDVFYFGNPTNINQKITGNGSIKKAGN